ncbi:MAG TPA: hypothetical protein VGQ33_01565, partial [Vicinamibacteria bacterium]|nr:hypothetical protein [Vicinamibacteria bacterium]
MSAHMLTGREELARALLLHVAAGTIDAREAAAAVRALLAEPAAAAPPRLALLQSLRALPVEGLQPLVDRLRLLRLRDAEAAYELKRAGHPLPLDLAAELADLPLDGPIDWSAAAAG